MTSHRLLVAPLPGLYIRRSLSFWVLLHMARIVVSVMIAYVANVEIHPADLLPGGNPLIVALVPVLGVVEARRRNEDLFLANLGYGWPTPAAYLLVPAAALEAACTVLWLGRGMLAAYAALPLAVFS